MDRSRVVQDAGVALNIDTGQRKAVLWCQTHSLGAVLDLDDPAFGDRLAGFFSAHQDCRASELPVQRPPLV